MTGYSAYWIGQIARRFNSLQVPTASGTAVTRCVQCGHTYPTHTFGSCKWLWLAHIPRAIAGVGGRRPPGWAGTSDATSVVTWAGASCCGSGSEVYVSWQQYWQSRKSRSDCVQPMGCKTRPRTAHRHREAGGSGEERGRDRGLRFASHNILGYSGTQVAHEL